MRIIQGDALEKLRELPDESVQCCVTSPPYWGLRDYGTGKWEGGDDPNCDHQPPQEWIDHNFNANSAFGYGTATQSAAAKGRWYSKDGSCPGCGAKRIDSQLGLEKTPEEYVAQMVAVFREVRRVLKDDGTLWLNLGDSYATASKGSGGPSEISNNGSRYQPVKLNHGLKQKDLVGIPWMVAFALRADGWYLRSDIIWAKPNPMPESVTDRPTKSHEYIFLLSKSQRYFYDADAIREPQSEGTFERYRPGERISSFNKSGGSDRKNATFAAATPLAILPNGRNKRSVWTVTTQPYPEAHFATYPPDLIKPCILAGSKIGDTILDPFGGSGTTGQAALELGRNATLIELNPKYISLIEQRCNVTPGFL